MSVYRHMLSVLILVALLVLGVFLLLGRSFRIAHADTEEWFVTSSGDGACSQIDPCDLQTALVQANSGDAIYAAQGMYTGSGGAVITVTKSITLYGGWDGSVTTPPMRNPEVYPTVIDGEEARRGLYIIGPATVTLEGLTIANGQVISATTTGWDGAGLYARDIDLTVRHTKFYRNVADVYDVDNSHAYGGGMCVEGGTLLVDTSTFEANSTWAKSSSFGGGLVISGNLEATVTGTTFLNNDAWHAGGLYVRGKTAGGASLLLSGNTFVGNGRGRSRGRASAGYAGAIKIVSAQAEIVNNIFRDNRVANDYGAVHIGSSDLHFTRNRIIDNESGGTSGLHLQSVVPFTVSNNIIAGNESTYAWRVTPAIQVRAGEGRFLHNTVAQNESGHGFLIDTNAVVTLTNTLLLSHTVGITVTEDSTVTLYSTLFYDHPDGDTGGDGTIFNISPINQNPHLTADYHLSCGSAAVDVGMDVGVLSDIDGDVRPQDDGYDIGADEFVGWCVYLPLALR